MPLIHIELFEGRTPAQKKELAVAITKETARILQCAESAVDIVYTDIKKHDWATAGVMWSEKT